MTTKNEMKKKNRKTENQKTRKKMIKYIIEVNKTHKSTRQLCVDKIFIKIKNRKKKKKKKKKKNNQQQKH